VDAQKLLIHERGQGEAVERVHTRVVHLLRVLDFTWQKKHEERAASLTSKEPEISTFLHIQLTLHDG